MFVPIYAYYAENPQRYQYSSNPNVGYGWIKGGVAFYADENESQEPGMVPIYTYDAENPQRYQYSSNPNVGHGWRKLGVAFYAYKNQGLGMVPIYTYDSENPQRYQYSSNPNVGYGWRKLGVAFYAISGDIQWKYVFDSITYNESLRPPTQQDLVLEEVIRNKSEKSVLEKTISLTKKTSSTFEWGLTQTLGIGAKLGFEAKVPFGKVSGEYSVQLDLGAHQKWTNTKEQELKFEKKVTVPPGESIVVKGFVDFAENVVTPFKIKIRVSATSIDNMVLSGDQIGQIFKQMNPDSTIENTFYDRIIVSLRGEFSGAYAINTSTDVEPLS